MTSKKLPKGAITGDDLATEAGRQKAKQASYVLGELADNMHDKRGKNWERFITKDSGEREEYESGMVRDTQAGKADYTLIDRPFLKRWAELMTRGAEKYGRNNWRKANSEAELYRFKASAFRHLMQWLEGDTEEDHAAAVCFNLAAAEHVWSKIQDLYGCLVQQALRSV